MPCPKQVFTTNQGQRVMIVQCVSHVMSVLCAGSQQTNHGQNTKDTLLPVRLSRGNIRRMSLLQVSFLIFILTNLSNKHNFCLWLAIILFSMVEFQFTPLLISVTYATEPAMLHDSSGSNQKVTHMNVFLSHPPSSEDCPVLWLCLYLEITGTKQHLFFRLNAWVQPVVMIIFQHPVFMGTWTYGTSTGNCRCVYFSVCQSYLSFHHVIIICGFFLRLEKFILLSFSFQKHLAFNIDPRDPVIAMKTGNHVSVIEVPNKPQKPVKPTPPQQ